MVVGVDSGCLDVSATKHERHAGIELFRIVMMFGICMIHACRQGQYARHDAFTAILCASVVGFIFISGYFGVSFKLSKVVRMYALCVFYCCIVPLIGGDCREGYVKAVLSTWGAQWRFWFLHAYVILMAISPLINKSFNVDNGDVKVVIYNALPILFVVFVWGWLSCFPSLAMLIPCPAGMTGTSFFTMIGIYIAARIFKLIRVEKRISASNLVIGLFIMLGVYCLLGGRCEPYMCPVAFALVSILFCISSRIRLYGWMRKAVLLIAPSMFGIYILNAALYLPGMDSKVYGLLNAVRDPLVSGGLNWYFACLSAALAVFSLCLLVDVIRRMFLRLFFPKVARCDEMLNAFYDKVAEKIGCFVAE